MAAVSEMSSAGSNFLLTALKLTFGSVDLVTADGHQINFPVRDADGNLPDGLSGVSVEEDSFRVTNLTCGELMLRSELRIHVSTEIRFILDHWQIIPSYLDIMILFYV